MINLPKIDSTIFLEIEKKKESATRPGHIQVQISEICLGNSQQCSPGASDSWYSPHSRLESTEKEDKMECAFIYIYTYILWIDFLQIQNNLS